MITEEKIIKVYNLVEEEFSKLENNSQNRNIIINHLTNILAIYNDKNYIIKCDEENNPSDIIDLNCIIVKVTYDIQPNNTFKYLILLFGDKNNFNLIYPVL